MIGEKWGYITGIVITVVIVLTIGVNIHNTVEKGHIEKVRMLEGGGELICSNPKDGSTFVRFP